jgi:5-aminopentanamidase
MRVAFAQTHPIFGEKQRNLEAALALCRGEPAGLYVLPELFATGYQFRSEDEVASLAESASGPTIRRLRDFCRMGGCFMVAGLVEGEGGSFYNSAALVGPTGLVHVYRKAHLFSNEKRWFRPGDSGFGVHEIALPGPGGARLRLGVMICFDWVFPEAARTLALGGAQCIAHPSNLVLPFGQRGMWTRSVENRVFTITANRVGSEDRTDEPPLLFTGGSQIVAPDGRVLASATADAACARSVDIDPAMADDKHPVAGNDLFRDRRPDLYRL